MSKITLKDQDLVNILSEVKLLLEQKEIVHYLQCEYDLLRFSDESLSFLENLNVPLRNIEP